MYRIKEDEFDKAYEILENSFPKCELRVYDKMKKFFDEGILVFEGIKEEDTLIGVLLVWPLDSCIYLENFATIESVRGKGYGSRMLDSIKEKYNDKIIILEVEEPYDDLSTRRIEFYKRNDFVLNEYGYMQPPLQEEINEIPLRIMSVHQMINEDVFKEIKKEIFNKVYQID